MPFGPPASGESAPVPSNCSYQRNVRACSTHIAMCDRPPVVLTGGLPEQRYWASDQQPAAALQVVAGRRSHIVTAPGVVKFAALLPATERGKTTSVTAEPATVVPGITVQSVPTVHPPPVVAPATTPSPSPMMPCTSVNSAVPPPAGCTL